MTEKVNLPVRKFIEQKIADNFKEIDFRRGTAFNDLVAKPAALLFQPFRHELNMLKINQSILNFDNMSAEDVDLLIGNIFIRRAAASKSTGNVRLFFRNTGIFIFNRLIFSTQAGLRFINLSTVNTTVNGLLANRSDDGLYFLDIIVQAENAGSQYSVKAGEIQFIENQPSQIVKVENLDDFGMVTDEEDNSQLYAKARRSIAVRNLINDSSIQSVLFNQFPFIRDIFVVGAGDVQMIRDEVILPTVPPATIHVGGMTDVYVDTTGITASELNIGSIPETGVIDCVSSAEQTLLFKFESGVIDDTFFFDFNNKFYDGINQLVTRGNKLKVYSREFSELIVKEYPIEQVLEDNRLRISGGIKSSVLDGVIFENGNIIFEFIQGSYSSLYGIKSGEYFSQGAGNAHKISSVEETNIELTPDDSIILNLIFNNEIPIDGTSSVINFPGIGGVIATPTEVEVGDILEMVYSNAWGRYIVYDRIDDDNLLVFPESATVTPIVVTFAGTNVTSTALTPGTILTVSDPLAANNGQSYQVVTATTLDRVHGEGVSVLNCYVSDKIITEDISAATPFKIIRKRVKEIVATTVADQLTSNVTPGQFFFVTANTSQYKIGDTVQFVGNATPLKIVGIQKGASNKMQVDGQITLAQLIGVTPILRRYSVNLFSAPTVIFNRFVHTGKFTADITGPFTNIPLQFVGTNAWPSYKFIIHDGASAGIYTIDPTNQMNPDLGSLSIAIATSVAAGDSFSIAESIDQVGSAHDDILYVPTFGNDLTAVSGSFPNSDVTHFVNIVNGENAGVYEVVEYLDVNRVRINGSLANTGQKLYTKIKFINFTASGSNVIAEPGTPFVGVTVNDTLIIERSGTLSYHNVLANAGNNTLTIFPALEDDIIGGNTNYTLIHDTMNPFVITSVQTPFEIHALPAIFDRRTEGIHAQLADSTFVFSDSDANFLDVFDGVNPAGYEIYILEGTHARTQPYIISGILTPTSLSISNASYDDSTEDSPNFDSGTGFIGSSSPSGSEKYEIKKSTSLLAPLSYEIYEDYSYYSGTFFRLPILALRDITLIDSETGELSSTPLVEPTDFSLGIRKASERYSVLERPIIQFSDPVAFQFKQVRIRYYSDPNIKIVHDFCMDKANRITNNFLLVKRMESTFVEISISVEGNVERQVVEDTINEYITTRKSQEPIEASDIIQKLYEIGITYVNTETLELKSIYYTSDGQRIESSSRTRIVSESTATYIPGVININLTLTT
jgi:hypothetical protein